MLPKRGIEPRLTGEGESRPAAKLQAAAMEGLGLGKKKEVAEDKAGAGSWRIKASGRTRAARGSPAAVAMCGTLRFVLCPLEQSKTGGSGF